MEVIAEHACAHTNVDVNDKTTFWARILSATAVAVNECLIFRKGHKEAPPLQVAISSMCLCDILQEIPSFV